MNRSPALKRLIVVLLMTFAAGCATPDRMWEKAKNSNDIEVLEKFLERYPKSEFALQAAVKLAELYELRDLEKELRDWEKAKNIDNPKAYESFLDEYPRSKFADQARTRMELMLKDMPAWEAANQRGSISAFKKFLEEHPQSPYAESAKSIIGDLESDKYVLRHILDAVKSDMVEIDIVGSGIRSISLRIRRLVDRQVKVKIPAGSFFVCRGAAQNMVTRESKHISLYDNIWKTVAIPVACANRSRRIPGKDDRYDLQESPNQAELARLMPLLDKAGASYDIEQAAVWIVTDNADYSDLGLLVRNSPGMLVFGGTRVIDENEAARAMKILVAAGINIKKKAIWRDRKKILSALSDGTLKTWLEGMEK